ncbi:MAG: Brp/Blh family beta-carotene 15,15'-dioxygenase [Verrucomicrobia bacterium]|nr:Brp/Blh family beta-carotene 15,15'-dioxygenase [Verrucomicrobiota bacterium]
MKSFDRWPLLGGYAAAVGASFVLHWVAPQLTQAVAGWVFLGTMLVFGLPHGATDLWVGILRHDRLRFLTAYLGVAAVVGAAAWLWPVASFVAFLGLTVFHWGTGDFARQAHSDVRWLALGLSRGLLVVAGAIVGDPATSGPLARAVTGQELPWLAPWAMVALGVGGLGHLAALWHWSARHPASARRTLLESTLLVAAGLWLPAFLSIGLYFSLLHARRHLARVAAIPRQGPPDGPGWRTACTVLATTLSVLGLLASWQLLPAGPGIDEWIPRYFVLLQLLTWPHAALVARLDGDVRSCGAGPRPRGASAGER